MDSACRARLPDTTAFPFSVFCTHVEFVFIPMPDSVWLPGINERIWRFLGGNFIPVSKSLLKLIYFLCK